MIPSSESELANFFSQIQSCPAELVARVVSFSSSLARFTSGVAPGGGFSCVWSWGSRVCRNLETRVVLRHWFLVTPDLSSESVSHRRVLRWWLRVGFVEDGDVRPVSLWRRVVCGFTWCASWFSSRVLLHRSELSGDDVCGLLRC